MEKLKKIIIICIIIIIIIIIAINIANKEDENKNIITTQLGDYDENYEKNFVVDESVKKVTNRTEYYIIKNIIDKYFNFVSMININPKTDIQKEDSDFALSVLTDMFSKKYIKEIDLTNENLINNVQNYIGCDYDIEDVYTKEKSINSSVFLVNVNINNNSNIYFIIVLNFDEEIYEIYADDYVKKHKYNEEIESLKNFEADNIEKNNFNQFKGEIITDQDIANDYFNYYKYNILENVEKAYNCLDEDYRNKRFGSLDEFKKYIEENRNIFKEITMQQYVCYPYDDYQEYVCKDQNENLYIFKERAINEYTLQLDTYTIITEKFKEEYEAASVEKKVVMNIGKFIDMINNYDYKSAYKVLNESFKEKYLETEEKFKQYMKNTYYDCNSIDLEKFSNENEIFIYEGIMRNKFYDDTDETKKFNIVMKLKSNTDFEMSFEII